MKPISTSIYTFEDLIKYNCVYVDKTKYLYNLLTAPKGQFFCARPRRFGKSLTISTLEAIFKGKRELFKGLFIDKSDYSWDIHPVIHIDFARADMATLDTVILSLKSTLCRIAKDYGIKINDNPPTVMFADLIANLYDKTGTDVALLIDEYDKPILEHIDNLDDAERYRDFIANFYQIIKGSERYLRFVFLTGVTKFSKVSIFSKLNNLTDITMDPDYGTMFGYTQEELEENFADRIEASTEEAGLTREELLRNMKVWYDGYKFTSKSATVYNPVSVGEFFNSHAAFDNYWFATGTPTFLMKILKNNHIVLTDLTERILSKNSFNNFNLEDLNTTSPNDERLTQLLFQSGYLTIDTVLWRSPDETYQLRFPNKEVAYSFERNLLVTYANKSASVDDIARIRLAAMKGDTEKMMEKMKEFFSALPYDIQVKEEKYYQSIVYTIFRMCNMTMMAEVSTNIGRIDGVLDGGKHLYIIEFKLNKSADVALDQIDEKKYTEKFIIPAKEKGQTIHKLGISFSYDAKNRNVTEWKEEIVK